jgi:hypothetical protein
MAQRISPQAARQHIEDNYALLVCAYDGDEKFHENHLDGAIPLEQLQHQEGVLSTDREIIFYCA